MARRRPAPRPPLDPVLVSLAITFFVLLIIYLWRARGPLAPPPPAAPSDLAPPPAAAAGEYLFCTWNVENLFDDRDDPKARDADEDYFGTHPEAVARKLDLLARTLLLQGEGRGPDILAVVEVENRRAVELLRDALNAKLPLNLYYTGIAQRDNLTGRRFGPAVLTRLAVLDGRTRANAGGRRILEAHLSAGGPELVVLVSHWTSRLRDGDEPKRAAYADALHATYRSLSALDPAVDLILCGDYNDEPDDPSLTDHLHAVADPSTVVPGGDALLDLLAGRDPETFGTYYHAGKWSILDHIVASPGLLDAEGWQVEPESLRVEAPASIRGGAAGYPRRFGNANNKNPRGPSDHFALTVKLRLSMAADGP